MRDFVPSPDSSRRGAARRRRLLPALLAVGAAALVLGAAATRALGARAERLYPMEGEHVRVDGLDQHVLVRGEGPSVVLVHGAYGGLQDFRATLLEPLSRRYRCVLWDRPGHGYSERPEGPAGPGVQAGVLLGVLEALEVERPLLVGFSYGGAVCLAAALEAPERVRGVVLVNGPSHPWPDPPDLEVRLDAVPVLGALFAHTLAAPLGHLLRGSAVARAFEPLPVPDSFESSPLPLALRPASYRANVEDVRLLKPFLRAQVPRYDALEVPVHALVATDDRVVSPTLHAPQLAEAAPGVRTVRIEGAGHQLLYTHPARVLAEIHAAMEAR